MYRREFGPEGERQIDKERGGRGGERERGREREHNVRNKLSALPEEEVSLFKDIFNL